VKIILGDNPFFGVNHAGRGNELYQKRSNVKAGECISSASNNGFDIFMLSPHPESNEILNLFNEFPLDICLVWPLPHAINTRIAQTGYFGLVRDYLSLRNIYSVLSTIFSVLIRSKKIYGIKRLIYYAIKKDIIYFRHPSSVKYVALHNIFTDVFLASDRKQIIVDFVQAVEDAELTPVIITQNVQSALEVLDKYKLTNRVILCGSINCLGYMMETELKNYIQLLEKFRSRGGKFWGMQILASGSSNLDDVEKCGFLEECDGVVYASSKSYRVVEFAGFIQRHKEV